VKLFSVDLLQSPGAAFPQPLRLRDLIAPYPRLWPSMRSKALQFADQQWRLVVYAVHHQASPGFPGAHHSGRRSLSDVELAVDFQEHTTPTMCHCVLLPRPLTSNEAWHTYRRRVAVYGRVGRGRCAGRLAWRAAWPRVGGSVAKWCMQAERAGLRGLEKVSGEEVGQPGKQGRGPALPPHFSVPAAWQCLYGRGYRDGCLSVT